MNTIEYKKMEANEKNYWWHVGRLKIIEMELGRQLETKGRLKILNIGSGTGGTINMLEKFGEVVNVDVSDEAISFMKKNGFTNIVKVEGIELPFSEDLFDVVCAFDVLEHIDKDIAALLEWKRVLKQNGKIFLTVPAYQWLWSGHDVSLHHYRRYTVGILKSYANNVGLHSNKVTYAIVFSFPLIVIFRMISVIQGKKLTSESSYVKLPRMVNSLFTRTLFAEALFHGIIHFPFGTSVMAVFDKSQASKQ